MEPKKENFFSSLINSIKVKLNIGGVKTELNVPGVLAKTGGTYAGTIIYTSKRDAQIKKIEVKLVEKVTTETGDKTTTHTFTLGQAMLEGFSIKTDEVKNIEIAIPYNIASTDNDDLKEKGGAWKAIGVLGAMATKEKKEFSLEVTTQIEGSGSSYKTQTLGLQ